MPTTRLKAWSFSTGIEFAGGTMTLPNIRCRGAARPAAARAQNFSGRHRRDGAAAVGLFRVPPRGLLRGRTVGARRRARILLLRIVRRSTLPLRAPQPRRDRGSSISRRRSPTTTARSTLALGDYRRAEAAARRRRARPGRHRRRAGGTPRLSFPPAGGQGARGSLPRAFRPAHPARPGAGAEALRSASSACRRRPSPPCTGASRAREVTAPNGRMASSPVNQIGLMP